MADLQKPSLAKRIIGYSLLLFMGYSTGYHKAERKFENDYILCQQVVEDARKLQNRLEERLEEIKKTRNETKSALDEAIDMADKFYRNVF